MSASTPSMAPVVESTYSTLFHQSHSPPDLMLLSSSPLSFSRHTAPTTTTATTTATTTTTTTSTIRKVSPPSPAGPTSSFSSSSSHARHSSLLRTDKALPSLPAFDVPSIDVDFDFDGDFDFSTVLKRRSQLGKPKKPASPTPLESSRRVWHEFARKEPLDAELTAGINIDRTNSSVSSTSAKTDTAIQSNSVHSVHSVPSAPSAPSADTESASLPWTIPEIELTRVIDWTADEKSLDRDTERLRSWIPSTKSSPNLRQLQAAPAAVAAKDSRDGDAVLPALENPSLTDDTMVERPRTASASLVGFARRSWLSRTPSDATPLSDSGSTSSSSPAPSPTPQKSASLLLKPVSRKASVRNGDDSEDGGIFSRKLSRRRFVSHGSAVEEAIKKAPAELSGSSSGSSSSGVVGSSLLGGGEARSGSSSGASDASDSTIGPTTSNTALSLANDSAAVSTTLAAPTATTSSSSKTFSRASGYLTRIRQRPQSMFSRVGSNSSLNTLAKTASDCDRNEEEGSGSGNGNGNGNGSSPVTVSGSLSKPRPRLRLPLDFLSDTSTSASGQNSTLTTTESSASSTDGSSANDSSALPASENESLTTADTSHQASPMARHPSSRDPLWIAFKDLEASFFIFLSKSNTEYRISIVRMSLVPFLRRYALDSSNSNTNLLSPEDIEWRTTILSRWWTSVLEMFDGPSPGDGSNNEANASAPPPPSNRSTYFPTANNVGNNLYPVPAADRPLLLEAMSMIMQRPEWRLLTTVFRPLADRKSSERVRARSNTGDGPPLEEASFLVEESVEHNVRTNFINNLMAQLAFVVDKMSTRQVHMSMVNFSGRTCAYAFFFVPGVADILVRLWGLDKSIDLVRRAADAFGLPRRSRGESEDLVALFPPGIGPLGWSSVSSIHAKLRRPPQTNLLLSTSTSCNRIPWLAPYWLSRWRGSETDLLFVFSKYYHLLADEFMPPMLQLPLVEKARAPAFVLLHAQLLHILDTTVHRQAAVEAAMMMAASPMADGAPAPGTADAFVPPFLMQPMHNLLREMDENRMIALLNDVLRVDDSLSGARNTFCQTLMALLKAAACRTSQYDHNACYMLCDFLQETLLAFDGYYGYSSKNASNGALTDSTLVSEPVDFVDWDFWLDVCQRMLVSNNTMSEIRVLSFIFAAWDIVAADADRKEKLCMGWLLTEDNFGKFFNNWCPMVRAYYMRLLCWRMCRDPGSADDLDAKIFLLVSQRLKTTWSHYLWLKQKADKEGTLPPATAPSLPQPGKRFMIVRTEVNVPQPGLLANGVSSDVHGNPTFDSLSDSLKTSNSPPALTSFSSLIDDKKVDGSAGSTKKRWTLLGKVLSISSNGKSESDDPLEKARRETAASRTVSGNTSASGKTKRLGSAASSDSESSTGSAPVFDSAQFVFKFMLHNIPWQGQGGGPMGSPGGIILPPVYRDRILTRPRLPAPAQARVSARLAGLGARPESPPSQEPDETRRVSGAVAGGLISEARNANPVETTPAIETGREPVDSASTKGKNTPMRADSGASLGSTDTADNNFLRPNVDASKDIPMYGRQSPVSRSLNRSGWTIPRSNSPLVLSGPPEDDFERVRERERMVVQPMEPSGSTALLQAKYAGRALAEWSLVINECNSFVDRRRDEGVPGLREVEVPTLGIDGLRRLG